LRAKDGRLPEVTDPYREYHRTDLGNFFYTHSHAQHDTPVFCTASPIFYKYFQRIDGFRNPNKILTLFGLTFSAPRPKFPQKIASTGYGQLISGDCITVEANRTPLVTPHHLFLYGKSKLKLHAVPWIMEGLEER
jgi:hypothetical protein